MNDNKDLDNSPNLDDEIDYALIPCFECGLPAYECRCGWPVNKEEPGP